MVADRRRYRTFSGLFLDVSAIGVTGHGVPQLGVGRGRDVFRRNIPTVAIRSPLKTITTLDAGAVASTVKMEGTIEEVAPVVSEATIEDVSQSQNGMLLRPQAMHRNVSPVLIFETLVKMVCRHCVEDQAQQDSLFHVICQQMYRMQLLPHVNEDVISPLRGQYLVAFEGLLNAAKIAVQNNDVNTFTVAAGDYFVGKSYQVPLGYEGLLKFQMCMYQHSRYRTEFEQISKIGKGGGGTVFKAKYKLDGTMYAVKKIPIKFKIAGDDKFGQIIKEALVLAKLNHPNIVNYKTAWIDYCTDPDCQCNSSSEDSSQASSGVNLDSTSSLSKFSANRSFIAERGDFTPNPLEIDDCEESDSIIFDDEAPRDRIVEICTPQLVISESEDLVEQDLYHSGIPKIAVTVENQVCTNEVRRSLLMRKRSVSYEERALVKLDVSFTDKAKLVKKKSLSAEEKSGIDICLTPLALNSYCKTKRIKTLSPFPLPVQDGLIPKCQDVLVIQMELCSITLRDWLDERNCVLRDQADTGDNISIIDLKTVLNFFKQILEGVQCFHSQGILHRDLKPKNIFFNIDRSQLKVGDFGLATYEEQAKNVTSSFGGLHTSNIGTKLYAAPEQISSSCYDLKADIYSLGIILYEMLNPFKTEMERSDCIRKLKASLLATEQLSHRPELADLITTMVSTEPRNRPPAQEILQMPVFCSGHSQALARQESTDSGLPASPLAVEEQLSPRLLEEKLRIKCAENEYLKRQLERMDHKYRKYRYEKESELAAIRASTVRKEEEYERQLHQKEAEVESLKACLELQPMMFHRQGEHRRLRNRNRPPSGYE